MFVYHRSVVVAIANNVLALGKSLVHNARSLWVRSSAGQRLSDHRPRHARCIEAQRVEAVPIDL